MNIVLLSLAVLGVAPAAWPAWAAPITALAILSIETQAATMLGAPLRLWHLAVGHALVAAAVAARTGSRQRLLERLRALRPGRMPGGAWAGANDRRVTLTALALVMAVLAVRATFFVAESADPYHLVKTAMLADALSIAHVPALDSKINVLGFLHELALADLSLGSAALQPWLGWQGPLFVGIYVACVVALLRRAATPLPWYAVLLPCLVPVVFHQGVLVKNDLFAALLVLPVLWALRRPRPEFDPLFAGALVGLAMSVKATMAPVALALVCFLPWTPVRLAVRTRRRAMTGLVAGVVLGGLVYVSIANVATYGNIAGPIADSGNIVTGARDAAVSLGRFVLSWFDASLLTRQLWPDRGGWGGAFGPAFVWAMAVLVAHGVRHPNPRRTLGIVLACLVPFGLLYPDADLAHRLALAPAVLAIVSAVELEAVRGAFSRWSLSAVAALLCVVLSGAMIARSSAAYVRQAEYARWPWLARSLEPSPGALDANPVWQMRQVDARLDAEHICLVGPENALAIGSRSWTPAVVVQRDGTGFSNRWQPDALRGCRSIVVLPNDFPPPDVVSAAALAECGVEEAAGPAVPVSAVRCP